MDLFDRKNLTTELGYQTALWTFTDEGQSEQVVDIYIRSTRDIYYYRERYTGRRPELSVLCRTTYQKGICSPRPYHQHLPHDASMFYCVLASFAACCAAWNIDSLLLLKESDPIARVSLDDLKAIREHARWEGAAFPGAWDPRAVESLCDSLQSLDCHALAALLPSRTLRARRA